MTTTNQALAITAKAAIEAFLDQVVPEGVIGPESSDRLSLAAGTLRTWSVR